MLGEVDGFLAQSLLKAFHKIHEVLHGVLLISDLALMARVIVHIAEYIARIDVVLISVQEFSEKVLQFLRHLDRVLLSFSLHGFIRTLFRLLRLSICGTQRCKEHLLVHVRHKKEGLDEGVEVACVAHVFEAHWGPILAHPLVQSERL